ncbi:hypothetical protein IHQ71_00390 [Rhizobium sp. TH2]|uniref:hypothetical protein n=1 Tax=Rhizobium sp. TH2 TaxID=2775403 RepID=UPI0021570B3C|nr:hypothetical protein [Rhizobium sp. TH2]UVC09132.1 hypothetical protein IHQ71_00390 [Rhizobium sp. TH2]
MRHPKGIDLSGKEHLISHSYEHDGKSYDTLRDVSEWQVLGGKCSKCGRVAWVDKKAVLAKVGNQYLLNLGRHLTCTCGNKDGNRVMIGHISRNA